MVRCFVRGRAVACAPMRASRPALVFGLRCWPPRATAEASTARRTKHAFGKAGFPRHRGRGRSHASTGRWRGNFRFERANPCLVRDGVGADLGGRRRTGIDRRDGHRRIASRSDVTRRPFLELDVANRQNRRRRDARAGRFIAYRRLGACGAGAQKDNREATAPNEAPDREARAHGQKRRGAA